MYKHIILSFAIFSFGCVDDTVSASEANSTTHPGGTEEVGDGDGEAMDTSTTGDGDEEDTSSESTSGDGDGDPGCEPLTKGEVLNWIATTVVPMQFEAFQPPDDPSSEDVHPEHPYYKAFEFFLAKGWISLFVDNTIHVDDPLNHAEFARIFLFTFAGLEECMDLDPATFEDVPQEAWFSLYTLCLAEWGCVPDLVSSMMFEPAAPVDDCFLGMVEATACWPPEQP